MLRIFRPICIGAIFISVVMGYRSAHAVEIPPTPTAHYYGDADGNVSINLSDIAQHNAYTSFKPCTYDTLQPQTSGQYWNTCDVDGNRSCNLSDIAILNSYTSFKPVNLGGDPWVLENVNLPISGNAPNRWIPFNINLYMTYSGAPSGRPGISVIAEIDPASPGHGQLSGRSCTPVAGTRDQLAELGAQCALAVTITDWQAGQEGLGLTESGTYGFQVWGDGDGDLKIDFHIETWSAMDIPSVALPQTVSFNSPCAVDLQCPASFGETSPISCPFVYSGCTGTPDVGPANTCDIAGIIDNGDGTGVYNSYAQGEAAGPGSCVAEVLMSPDGVSDSDAINIVEENEVPHWDVFPVDISVPTGYSYNRVNGQLSDTDLPAQTLTCSSYGDTCSFNVTVTGSGSGTAACTISFFSGGSETCSVNLKISDGYDSMNRSVNINVGSNSPPDYVELPTTINCSLGDICGAVMTKRDIDIPQQTLTSQIAGTNPNPVTTTSTAAALGAGDTAIDTPADAAAQDAGTPINGSVPFDNQYSVIKGARMELINWNVSAIPAGVTITAVTLRVVYGTIDAAGSMNTAVQYNGIDTTIIPTPTNLSWLYQEYDLFAAGIDTKTEIQNLNIGYSNNTGGGPNSRSMNFDAVQVIVEYVDMSGLDTCGWGVYTSTPGPSGTTDSYAGTPFALGICTVTLEVCDGIDCTQEDLNFNIVSGCYVNMACPDNVPETDGISCFVSFSQLNCIDAPSVGASNTCSNAEILVTGPGMANYLASPQGEAAWPGSCVAGVDMIADAAGDSKIIGIAEVNIAPKDNAPSSVIGNELEPISVNIAPTDQDIPAQTLACSLVSSDCAGGSLVGCQWSWTPSEADGPTSCVVQTKVSDGVIDSETVSTTVTVNEVNTPPVNNAPVTVSGDEGTLVSFDISPSDSDVPVQTLTCSVVDNTCPGGSLSVCTWSWNTAEADGPADCSVTTRVSDGVDNTDVVTNVIVNEVNANPTVLVDCPGNVLEDMPAVCTLTPSDTDLPPQALTCSVGAFTTCSGVTITDCSQVNVPPQGEAAGPGSCDVAVDILDSLGGSGQGSDTISIDEAYQPPYIALTCPASVTEPGPIDCSITAGDPDIPAISVTCSVAADDTCGGILTGCTGYNVPDTTGMLPGCRVSVDVTEDGDPFDMNNDFADVTIDPRPQMIIYVDDTATGANNGTSWADAFNVIRDAVDTAWVGDQIWVAEGNYYRPIGGNEPVLTMKDGVEIYGGFAGWESDLSERGNPADYPTILDGEDLSNHVVIAASNAKLYGFTITRGNAVSVGGGGIYNFNKVNLYVSQCILIDNYGFSGGGMANYNSSPAILDCSFKNNSAGGNAGGGIKNEYSSPIISNCIFDGNNANTSSGGAMYNYTNSSPVITNCLFINNSANSVGGAIRNYSSSPKMINCTFKGNSIMVSTGGAIYDGISSTEVTNCILWANIPDQISGTITVTYSNIQGGYTGNGNINTDPMFTSATDLHLQPTSPCIDTGTSTSAPTNDLDDNSRPSGLGIDMGAYEFQFECDDGIDNDGDTLIDYPADSSCAYISDNTEDGGWDEVGLGSASGGGISNGIGINGSEYPSLAIDSSGNPVVAWEDYSPGNWDIFLKRWDGSAWIELGGSATGGGISFNSGRSQSADLVLDSNGYPVVTWYDRTAGNDEIYLKRWDGSAWIQLAGSATGGGISNDGGNSYGPSIALDLAGNPFVTWYDTSANRAIYIKQWDGISWVEVGSGSASGKGISQSTGTPWAPSLVLDSSDYPVVAWQDSSPGNNEIYIKRWDGAAWVEWNTGSASGGGISNNSGSSRIPSLVLDSSDYPVVAWLDDTSGNEQIYLKRWDGSSWIELAGSATGGGLSNTSGNIFGLSLVLDFSGNPILAWGDSTSGNSEIYINRWNGVTWVEWNTGSASDGGISNIGGYSVAPSLALDPSGNPVIAWMVPSSGRYEIYIKRWVP